MHDDPTQDILIFPTHAFPTDGLWVAVAVGLIAIFLPLVMSLFYPSNAYFKNSWKLHAILVIGAAIVLPLIFIGSKLQIQGGELSFVPSVIVRYTMPLSDMAFRRLYESGGRANETIVSKDGWGIISIPSGLFPTAGLLQLDCILQRYAPWRGSVDLAKAASYGFTTAPGQATQCRKAPPKPLRASPVASPASTRR
jgi:hypothetical protein